MHHVRARETEQQQQQKDAVQVILVIEYGQIEYSEDDSSQQQRNYVYLLMYANYDF